MTIPTTARVMNHSTIEGPTRICFICFTLPRTHIGRIGYIGGIGGIGGIGRIGRIGRIGLSYQLPPHLFRERTSAPLEKEGTVKYRGSVWSLL